MMKVCEKSGLKSNHILNLIAFYIICKMQRFQVGGKGNRLHTTNQYMAVVLPKVLVEVVVNGRMEMESRPERCAFLSGGIRG